MKLKTNRVRLGSRPVLTRTIAPPLLAGLGLLALFPTTGGAATATGGTTTTMTLKYSATGVAQWVMRCDPEDVESFQLHFQFDEAEAAQMGIDLKNPFGNLKIAIDGANIQVSGSATTLSDGDVDVFEVRFNALPPLPAPPGAPVLGGNNKPLDQIKFVTFATGNDFLVSKNGAVSTRFTAAEIGAASRAVTPGGVSPLVWDPDGGYNNNIVGGSGTWTTGVTSFDNLPRGIAVGEPLADVGWVNTTNAHDIAAFGGNGGTVTVRTISAGGLQFDALGYTLQGTGLLTLSRNAGSVPTIDTGANDATVNVALAGTFEKLGTGTLNLGTLSTIGGPALGVSLTAITVKAGTVKTAVVVANSGDFALLDSYQASPPHTNVTLAGNGTFEYSAQNLAAPGTGSAVLPYGALAFTVGDGQVRSVADNSIFTGLTFTSLATSAGATGNFIVSGGTNGTDNRIDVPGTASQLLSPRLYFNGADFAAIDGGASGGFVRALQYGPVATGGDANTSAVNTIAAGTHVKLTATPAAQASVSLRTLNLTGSGTNLTFNAAQTLTLTEGGLLKAGGGASTITEANLTTGGTAPLVIRTDAASDSLTLAAAIAASSTGGLTKSGPGTLILSAANAYTGATTVNQGRLLVNAANGSSPVTLLADATLGGTGTVATIAGGGTVSPGSNTALPGLGAGILTAASLDASKETDFRFDVGATGATYNTNNDLIRLTGGTPFTSPLCATSRILFDLQLAGLVNGMTFIAGFFTDTTTDTSDLVKNAAFVSTLNGGRVPDNFGVVFSRMVAQTITFNGASVSGRAMEMRVLAPKLLQVNNGAWATGANWFTPGVPGTTDNAVIEAVGTIDINGGALAGGTQVQDISFTGAANTTLANASGTTNMILNLNGGRGTSVPLIDANADVSYTIAGTGAGGHTLALQLLTSGAISVEGAAKLDISAVIQQSGGTFSLTKTGTGALTLSGANTFSGGVTVSAGTLELFNPGAAGSGAITVNGGQLALRNLSIINAVTLQGGGLATRGGDAGAFAGTVNVSAGSTVSLVDYATPANSNSINITGMLSGSGGLTITGNNPETNGGGKALVLTNTANTYSGAFTVGAGQILRNAPAATGKTLGTGSVNLAGGLLQVRDNGTGSSGTLTYNNNVSVGTGGGGINVDRVSGVNTLNTVQFGTLTIGAQTLSFSGGNFYRAAFSGATTLTGAATLDVGLSGNVGMQVSLAGAVGGAFDLTKTGVGILRLQAANTYSGQTNINNGTLTLLGTATIASSPRINVAAGAIFDVASVTGGYMLAGTQTLAGAGSVSGGATALNGATVQPGGAAGVGTLTFSALTFGVAAANTNAVNFASLANSPKLNVTGATVAVGSVTLNVGGVGPAVGTYTLVDYAGAIAGGGFGAFALGTLPPRTTAVLVNNVVNTSIDLNVTAVDFPVWTGALSSVWSTATLAAPKNWRLAIGGDTTDYLTGDSVLFDDTVSGTPAVDVSAADVTASAITFNNNFINYTLTGSHAINGTAALTKNGFGTVTIKSTNGFTGSVTLNGGTLSVATLANIGASSSLGAGSIILLNGGTLDFTGAFGSTNRQIALAGSNTLSTTNALVLTGQITGGGALTKTGTGTLILTAANTLTGGVTINSGTLNVTTNAALGTGSGAVTINSGATLQAGGTLSTNARTVTLGGTGGIIDTNGNAISFGVGSTITGTVLTKIGAGRLTVSGTQTYDVLDTEGGRTDLASALGTGSSSIVANAETNTSVSQTLDTLIIGPGAVFTLTNPLPPAPAAPGGGDDFAGEPVQPVPEPGAAALLLFGALGFLRRIGRNAHR